MKTVDDFIEEIEKYSLEDLRMIADEQQEDYSAEQMYLIKAQLRYREAERCLELAKKTRSYSIPCVLTVMFPIFGVIFLIFNFSASFVLTVMFPVLGAIFLIYYIIDKNPTGCRKVLIAFIAGILLVGIIMYGRSVF